jgi:dipeptidyl aminopeptidase/acylaminoacyl peptidase
MRPRACSLPVVLVLLLAGADFLSAQQRPMDFPDLWRTVSVGSPDISPDGQWVLYVTNPRDFPTNRSDQEIHLASLDGTVDRQLTNWPDGQNTNPTWHPSGEFFAFHSTRYEGNRQIFFMRPDGGEARRVTDAERGVGSWAFSDDGRWLAWLQGRDAERQVWVMDVDTEGPARQVTRHPTPVESFEWRDGAHEILYTAADDWDAADAERRRDGFEARPIQRGLVFPDFVEWYPIHLWSIGVDGGSGTRLTEGDFRVTNLNQGPGGDHVVLTLGTMDPHADNRPNELYLLDRSSGELERLTDNDASEGVVGFSPDGSMLAIRLPSGGVYGGVQDIFVRPVAGGEWRGVTESFDNDIFGAFWDAEGSGFYVEGADGVNHQLFHFDLESGEYRQLTDVVGLASFATDDPEGPALIDFTDPHSPGDLYAADWGALGNQDGWTRLSDGNPWVEEIQLAEYETVRWTSDDGTEVEGILIYPVDYDAGRSYPMVTQIHGGPASAYRNSFSATHGTYPHVFAANGYAVFQPNYRGSSNYGNEFKEEIVGDYWTRATEDIHAGIDVLVDRGIAHPDSLGFMGWSAGGHWSNWMLVTTDRFKAISTGAGVTNWISLYGQTDNQASREYYLGRDPALDAPNQPWHDFDHWWDESPLKYITNASTPTLIHFGQEDQRIPMPQGQELHLALKKLGVPTEFMVYPNELHGLSNPRNQLVKAMSELGWFEKWIRGADHWLDWAEVLETARRVEEASEAVLAEDREDR